MALPQQYSQELFTEEEFLAFLDRVPPQNEEGGGWEFLPGGSRTTDGRPLGAIRARATGTDDHATLLQNIGVALSNVLRDRNCRVYPGAIMVHCPSGRNAIPDVAVVCGPRTYHQVRDQERHDIITNPLVVVEVLSESTEAEDRSGKWLSYQGISRLREYALVDARTSRVEVYRRGESGLWGYERHEGPEQAVSLASVGVTLPLSEIYRGVVPDGPAAPS